MSYDLILVEGINIVLSLFLLAVSSMAVKKGVRIFKYMLVSFAIIFISTFITALSAFNIGPAYFGSMIIPELALFLVMILFYVGVIKGN
ncbi:MAG: hypothetical protein ACYCSG_00775 [Thermoplasmataceae archaeon]|jgi:hypothetical protein